MFPVTWKIITSKLKCYLSNESAHPFEYNDQQKLYCLEDHNSNNIKNSDVNVHMIQRCLSLPYKIIIDHLHQSFSITNLCIIIAFLACVFFFISMCFKCTEQIPISQGNPWKYKISHLFKPNRRKYIFPFYLNLYINEIFH